MKKKIIIILSIVILLLGGFVIYKTISNNNVDSDNERFAKEYSSVDNDNVFAYKDMEEIIKILENGTGVVYLGFPECPWCTAYVKYLNEVALSNDVEVIYYHNVLEDRQNNTLEYQKVVSILSDYLQYDEEGNKRLYVPAVIGVRKGEIVFFDDETAWDTKGYETPEEYWEKEDLDGLKNRLDSLFSLTKTNICTSDCNK